MGHANKKMKPISSPRVIRPTMSMALTTSPSSAQTPVVRLAPLRPGSGTRTPAAFSAQALLQYGSYQYISQDRPFCKRGGRCFSCLQRLHLVIGRLRRTPFCFFYDMTESLIPTTVPSAAFTPRLPHIPPTPRPREKQRGRLIGIKQFIWCLRCMLAHCFSISSRSNIIRFLTQRTVTPMAVATSFSE